MDITILHSLEGAKKAKGLTVVIDVFRAFSTACYMYGNGAERIIPIGDINHAYALKKEHPEYVLIGERNGAMMPGFDFGNSPFQILHVNFQGKTIVHTTTAGTQGIVHATHADQILTGSFVNVGAIIKYINMQHPEQLSLVCTGTANEHIKDEDAMCAEYIRNALLGKDNSFPQIVEHLTTAGFTEYFLNPEIKSHPLEDLDLCLALNRFNFILKVERADDGLVYLQKRSI